MLPTTNTGAPCVPCESAPGVIPALDVVLATKDGAHSYHLVRERAEGIRAVAAIVRHELKHKELHEATGDATWLREAVALVDDMLARFWDPDGGGFFYVAADHEIDGRAYEALVEDIESRLKAK